jgi:ATP-binding cassette subfamily B protein
MQLSHAAGADLSYSIYQRTLYQPYEVHVARNSSEVIAGISTKVNVVINNLLQVLTFISSTVLLISILIALLFIDALVATTAIGGFLCIYIIIVRITRSRARANSNRIANNSSQVIKVLQEGLGGIRDVLIDGSQATYCTIYRQADLPLRQAQGSNSFISSSPRAGVEALSMVLIAALAYAMSKDTEGISKAIPVLGALALGAQRMLPAMQQAFASWASLRGDHASLKDAVDLLNQPLPAYAHLPALHPITFEKHIELKKISFRYAPDAPWVLKNLDLTIQNLVGSDEIPSVPSS